MYQTNIKQIPNKHETNMKQISEISFTYRQYSFQINIKNNYQTNIRCSASLPTSLACRKNLSLTFKTRIKDLESCRIKIYPEWDKNAQFHAWYVVHKPDMINPIWSEIRVV